MAGTRPLVTRGTHVLPFASLSPADFERLCFGLVRREGYERAEHLGATGRDDGCDIVAFRHGRRVVFQCKRYEKLGPKDAEAVVTEILSLPEEDRPAELILLATCTVSPEARQRARQKAGSIDFQVWALTELDERVNRYPDLLAQFFDLPQRTTPQSPPSPSGVTAVPSPPPHYLPRPEALATLKARLLAPDTARLGITSPRKTVGVQGMGGIGKSVLAAALAQDAEVKATFPDGVFWVAVGQQPDLIRLQVEFTVAAGEPRPALESPQQGKLLLSRLFAERAALLVLDDIWNLDHAAALNVLGPRGRLLITTRDAELLVGLGAEEFRVEVLDPEAALVLLADWAGQEVKDLPPEAARVAHECGYLPLALAMIGAMVRLRPTAWIDALDRLARADIGKIRRNFPDYPYPDLLKAVAVSVEALEAEERERYLELAVFPEEAAIPESTLETLWTVAGLPAADARDLAAKLATRSLAQRNADGSLRLHDLQADYLRHEAGDLGSLHSRLVDAYAARCPEGFARGPNDGYFFQHLASHLVGADRLAELRELLFTYLWMEAKLAATDVNALISDYDFLQDDPELRLVQGALRLSAHALVGAPEELPGQLHGRFGSRNEQRIASLVRETHSSRGLPWLRSLAPVFAEAGGALTRILTGHSSFVRAVEVLPDGRIVSASYDCTLRVWDVASGKTIKVLAGHSEPVSAVAVLPEGRVISASYDGTLRIWDIASGRTIGIIQGHRAFSALAVLPQNRVVSASFRDLQIWDLASGKILRTLKGHSAKVNAITAFTHGRVVSASSDGTLRVWNLAPGKTIQILNGHSDGVYSVAVLPDGRVVSASSDRTLRVWDLASGKTQILEGHSDGVYAVAVLPDGRLVSGSRDRTLRLWDLSFGKTRQILEGHSNEINAVAMLSDKCVVSASSDRTLGVWDLAAPKSRRPLEGHSNAVNSVAVLPGGGIVSASSDRTLRVWDLYSVKSLQTLEGHSNSVRSVAVRSDGLIISASRDRTLRIWDGASGKTLKTLEGHSLAVTAVAVMPDGHFVSASWDKTVRVWDAASGEILQTFKGHTSRVTALALLGDNRVVSSSNDHTLRVWDVASGQTLHTLIGHSGIVRAVAVMRNDRVVSASGDCTLRVWDVSSETTLRTLEGHSASVYAVAVLPDSRVISASQDRTVRIWDITTGQSVARLTLDAPPMALAILDDRGRFVVGDAVGHVFVLSLESAG